MAGEDEEDVCWCCLDAKHESGQPLRRDCSCRGGSGFVHLTCIVEYAEEFSKRNATSSKLFVKTWRTCPSCHHHFQNDLALDLANAFVAFVYKAYYPGDYWRPLRALHHKLEVLTQMHERSHERSEEAKQIVIQIHQMIEEVKTTEHPLPRGIRRYKAIAYRRMGNILMADETKESAKDAVKYFEKYLDICHSIGSPVEVLHAETYIARLKAKYEGGSTEAVREKCQTCYDGYVQRFGEDEICTIRTGISLAKTLRDAYHGVEAERWLTRLVATSTQAHGSNHLLTKDAESELQIQRERVVKDKSGNDFQVLHYSKCGNECLVKGPIASPRSKDTEKTLTFSTEDIRPALGTPIMCRGLGVSGNHLNGKVGDLRSFHEKTKCYEVHFEDTCLGPCQLRMEFIQILFDLPEII